MPSLLSRTYHLLNSPTLRLRTGGVAFGLCALLGALTTACGDAAAEKICDPGKVEACPCVGGEMGVQTCSDDGTTWGSCSCPGDDSTSDDSGSGTSASSSSSNGSEDDATSASASMSAGETNDASSEAESTTNGDGDGDGDGDAFEFFSNDFEEDTEIPVAYTCESDVAQINPHLQWGAMPFVAKHHLVLENMTTSELVWVAYDIAGDRTSIAPGEVTVGTLPPNPSGGTKQPDNINGEPRYAGPCPPSGVTHEFEFRLYKGLSAVLPNADLSSTMQEVLPWIEADSPTSAILSFTYTGE